MRRKKPTRQQTVSDENRDRGLTYKGVWVPEEDARKLDTYAKKLRRAAGILLPRD